MLEQGPQEASNGQIGRMGYDSSGKEHYVYQEMQVHHSAGVQTSVKGEKLEKQLDSVHDWHEGHYLKDKPVVTKVSLDW